MHPKIVTLILALLSPISTAFAADIDDLEWHNVVNIHPYQGELNSMANPNRTIRPFSGDWVQILWPYSCGRMYLDRLALWENQNGQRQKVSAELEVKREHVDKTVLYYRFRDKQNHELSHIGLQGFVEFDGCTIRIAQASSHPANLPPTEAICEEAKEFTWDSYREKLRFAAVTRIAGQCGIHLGFSNEEDLEYYEDHRRHLGLDPQMLKYHTDRGRVVDIRIRTEVI